MKIKIHRGSKEIGGCATEISTNTTKIMIDFGMELKDEGDDLIVEGLNSGKPNFDAVFFTHAHLDHIGLIDKIDKSIPVYMNKLATKLFEIYLKHIKKYELINRITPIEDFNVVKIGDMEITPIPCDHSAFASNMFLIEGDGKRILHTGDFRLHGEYRSNDSESNIKKYAKDVDALITEGTNVDKDVIHVRDEELEEEFKEVLKNNKYVFMLCSSSNIDRMALAYKNNPYGRYFIVDQYQKDVLDCVAQNTSIKGYDFKKALTYGDNLYDSFLERGFVMPIRAKAYFEKIMDKFPDSVLIYSMWKGYIKENKDIKRIIDKFSKDGKLHCLHSGGHIFNEDLLKVIDWIKPKRVIPIHTEHGEKIDCNNLVLLQDGEEIDLSENDFEIKDNILIKYNGKDKIVVVPQNINIIGEKAFYQNNNIESVIIGDSVKEINLEAFKHCVYLKSVTFGNGLKEIKNGAFEMCYNLAKVVIPDSVEVIGDKAFSNCCYLRKVVLGKGIKEMSNKAFYGSVRIIHVINRSNIDFSKPDENNIEYFRYAKFSKEEPYKSQITQDELGFHYYILDNEKILFNYTGDKEHIVIPNDVTSIQAYAFDGNKTIRSVIVGGNVNKIGAYSFNRCCNLESIIIQEGVKQIGKNAFLNSDNLKNITIPDSIEYLDKHCIKN